MLEDFRANVLKSAQVCGLIGASVNPKHKDERHKRLMSTPGPVLKEQKKARYCFTLQNDALNRNR